MAEYTQLYSGLGWGTTFEMNGRKPLVAKRSFPTLQDAYGYVNDLTATGTACPGLIIAVTNDIEKNNGIYWIKSVGTTNDEGQLVSGELVSAGSGAGSEAVDFYKDALALATEENMGQIIYVKTTTYKKGDDYTTNRDEADVNDKGEVTEYSAGPYVVTGASSVAKLGTTSASGDIAGDVEALKGEVNTLKETSIKGIKAENGVITPDNDKVVDLTSTLNVYAKLADLTDPLDRLSKMEDNAQENTIETITVAGVKLEPVSKAVSIAFDSVYDASSESENAIQHKAVAAVIEDLRGKISEIPKFKIEVVDELPEEGQNAVVYLKKQTGEETNNLYEEYIWTGSAYEMLGRQELDLTDYVTETELAEVLQSYATTKSVQETLSLYVTDASLKADYLDASTVNSLVEEKVSKKDGYSLVADASIELISTNASNIAELQLADSSLDSRVAVLEEKAVLAVSSETTYLDASVTNNNLGLSLTIGDFDGTNGLATVADVTVYVEEVVNTKITDAFEWNDVE